jgi:hypothetical protein
MWLLVFRMTLLGLVSVLLQRAQNLPNLMTKFNTNFVSSILTINRGGSLYGPVPY